MLTTVKNYLENDQLPNKDSIVRIIRPHRNVLDPEVLYSLAKIFVARQDLELASEYLILAIKKGHADPEDLL